MAALADGSTLSFARRSSASTMPPADETHTPAWVIEAARRGPDPELMGAAGAALVRALYQTDLHTQIEAVVECNAYESNDHHAKMQAVLADRKVQIVRDRTLAMQRLLEQL